MLLERLRGEVAHPLDLGTARAERVADDDGVGAVATELVVQLLDDGVRVAAASSTASCGRIATYSGPASAVRILSRSRSASTGVIARSAWGST